MNRRPARERLSGFGRIFGRALLPGVLLLSAWGAAVAWKRLDVPVSVVEVSGELTAAERARAIELVAAFLPAGVFELDTRTLQARLVAESWIDAAAVRRRWPDTVAIRIAPEVPVARWQGDALLSSRGAVIEPLEIIGVDSLPRLVGPPGTEQEVMRDFLIVTGVLRPLGMEVETLVRDAVGEVRVTTRRNVEIVLGPDRLGARLQRLAAVLSGRLAGRVDEVARLDARYDNGVAVAWRDLPLDARATAQLSTVAIGEAEESWPVAPQR
ncbi:MAG: cell division protein FtsQ/DivIB [Pseudomonadales bacterium]|jgi:cell division protein FtsQ|nr:cell division protein FtsQ/DivIB [Pseudomonadales bacterium]